MPRTSRSEPTQGRPVPTRLSHLQDGVANWGKRWTKTKKSAGNIPIGGEYNTFPVSGTTHEFNASAAPSFSVAQTSVGRSKSATSSAHRRAGSGAVVAKSSTMTPTITVDPGYDPVYDTVTAHPPPSPTPSTASSRLSPFSPSSPTSSTYWDGRHSTDDLLASTSPHTQARTLAVPSKSPSNTSGTGVYGAYSQGSLPSNTLASWNNTAAYTSDLLNMLESTTTTPQTSYSSGSYAPQYTPSSSNSGSIGWPATYSAPGNTTQWAPATAPTPRSQRAQQPAQPQRSPAPTSSGYAPTYISPTAPLPSASTSQRTSDARPTKRAPAAQYTPAPAPTYRSSAPQAPPVHSIGGYSAAPGYLATVPPPAQHAQQQHTGGAQQQAFAARTHGAAGHVDYAQHAAAVYIQEAQYGSVQEDVRPAQHAGAYHPYRRLP